MNDPMHRTPSEAHAPNGDAEFSTTLQAFASAGRVVELTDRLARCAQAELDLTWSTHDSPLGSLLLALHDGALVRVAFESEGFDAVVDSLATMFGYRTLRSGTGSDALRHQLDEYFDGRRARFDVPLTLTASPTSFRHEVQSHLRDIPYGTTASYADVARLAGRPRAVRAAGSACATNPLPIVVPCHRVVRSDGSFGHYLGGVAAKEFLLAHEARHRLDIGSGPPSRA